MYIKGEITAFLSLIFILVVAFIGALFESASIQVSKNILRADAVGALNSVFAEYQKVLLEEYDIFALDGTYETGNFSEEVIIGRLNYYGSGNMEHKITKLQLLTDQNGSGFQEQVIRYMQNKYGLDAINKYDKRVSVWQEHSEQGENFTEKEEVVYQNLQSEMETTDGKLLDENNPIESVNILKQANLLNIVMPDQKELSNRQIDLEAQSSKRTLKKGYGAIPQWKGIDSVQSKFFMNEYILEHFKTATEEEKDAELSYEVEYILAGKESDQENLQEVVKKLLLMRLGTNYVYIMSDQEKQMEAGALALTLSSLFALPVLTEAVKQAVLAAWAFGESIMDLRSLLDHKKVPLIKSRESWQLQLENLLTLGTSEDQQQGKDSADGQDYKEYLRMLLFLNSQNQNGARALDLIESNLQKNLGLTFFKVDQCISKMELKQEFVIGNEIKYQFTNYYGYQ